MASTFKWVGSTATQYVLQSELNALADGSLSSASHIIDNTEGLYQYGWFSFHLSASSGPVPNAGGYITVYCWPSWDGGTTYPTESASAFANALVTLPTLNGGLQDYTLTHASPVSLPPVKFKIGLYNKSGVTWVGNGGNQLMIASAYEQAV